MLSFARGLPVQGLERIQPVPIDQVLNKGPAQQVGRFVLELVEWPVPQICQRQILV